MCRAGEFCLWDGRSFTAESTMAGHEAPVRCIATTHAGHIILSCDDNGRIKVRHHVMVAANVSDLLQLCSAVGKRIMRTGGHFDVTTLGVLALAALHLSRHSRLRAGMPQLVSCIVESKRRQIGE
jgi:hypothetical protein